MKKITVFALLFALCVGFCGCIQPPSDQTYETEGGQEFVPAEDYEIDADILAEYEKHKTNASLAFTEYAPASADDFEYSEDNGSITLDKYIGSEKIVVIPEKIGEAAVTAIGEKCFAELDALRAVYVPDSVMGIGFGAFSGCESIATLRLPIVGDGGDNENVGYIFGASSVDYNRTEVPKSLEMIIFGEMVTEIPENSLSGFKSLRAVILPDTLEKIESFAFYECADLLYVRLGDALQSIGDYAFAGCSSLINIELGGSVTDIGLGAFMNCSSVKYMTLPYVGGSTDENLFLGYVFGAEYADWNKSFVPRSLTHITLLDSCTFIPDRAFSECEGLIDIQLPEGITSIGVRAFYGCSSLRKIAFPDSLEKISDDAFFYCRSLEEVSLGESSELREIGMQAFWGCEDLKAPALPKEVNVGSNAFWGCISEKNETES